MENRRWNSEWKKKGKQPIRIGRGLIRIALFVLCLLSGIAFLTEIWKEGKEERAEQAGGNAIFQEWLTQSILEVWLPEFALLQEKEYAYDDTEYAYDDSVFGRLVMENFPVLLYSMEQPDDEMAQAVQESEYEKLLLLEGKDEEQKGISQGELEYGADAIHLDKSLEEAFATENGFANENKNATQGAAAGTQGSMAQDDMAQNAQMNGESTAGNKDFFEVEEPIYRYQWEEMQSYDALKKAFYAIDSTTSAGEELLNTNQLLEKDMQLKGSNDKPQILIYHTHSQEAFADSIPGDVSTTIVGAGEKLANLLQEKYGYHVIHYTESFDKESRDYAYTNSLPALEQLLAQNPSIEVVIDLHRDAQPEERRLVVDLQGRPTAQFMFFNGLSRNGKGETIAYLENPNLEENLAFSFQMQVASNEYYPGIARRIYLKAYRYNMHLRGKSLLVELGAQNNTVEEIMNAIDPLAHILYLVLSGNVE